MKYTIEFFGREVGAIGIRMHQCVGVEAANVKDAILKVYSTHEHLSDVFVNSEPFTVDGKPRTLEEH